MAFSDADITSVTAIARAGDLYVSWISTAAAGTIYQIYLDGVMVWFGTATKTVIPVPMLPMGTIWVGTVGVGESQTDFSSTLSLPACRPCLQWQGGYYLGDDIAGFQIWMSAAAGGAVDYAAGPIATITAYPQNAALDGFGMGGFGSGGFGSAASYYEWIGPPLPTGTWNFAVKSIDLAGNMSSPWTSSVTVAGPPYPPALNSSLSRLTYSGGVLSWIAPTTPTLARLLGS